jgi:hypothetical protein
MKTTVDISDSLLLEARQVAAREGITLRALIERSLRRVIHEAAADTTFRLRRASYRGEGRQPEFADATWERVRDAAYRDRGA